MSKNAEAVKKSRAANGVMPTSVNLSPDERALWDAMALRYGGKKAALLAGLRALDKAQPMSKVDLLAEIERRLA